MSDATGDQSPAERYAAFRRSQSHPVLEDFREHYRFPLDEFQIAACKDIEDGRGVLVAAPTGSGKTVVGEFAIHLALSQGRKAFYTTPIKALSNQKYADLVARYGPDQVGLLTGDNTVNGEAPIVIMTTEVLRNMLYAGSRTLDRLGFVVMDEVHYLADRSRGAVWEEVIIHLPESVGLVALSATVSNAEEFGEWLETVRGDTSTIVEERRPVPLFQHVMVGRRLLDLFASSDVDAAAGFVKEGAPVNDELLKVARDDWAASRMRDRRSPRDRRGGGRSGPKSGNGRRVWVASRPDVITRLERDGLLPAIVFIFSRVGCVACHSHDDEQFKAIKQDQGPNLTRVAEKVKPGEEGFNWLYSWLRNPSRYHERTKMPNLYLDAYTQGEETIDPAADITAFLLSQGKAETFPVEEATDEALDSLVTLFLKKARFSEKAVENILASKQFPRKLEDTSGDEKVLATEDASAVADAADWRNRKLEYVGRKTISRYGCYGCHDIPGYEDARPIGVALQDWGRKDTSKLGLEHIEEFLHHHGETGYKNFDEAMGESTRDRVEEGMAMAEDGSIEAEELGPEMTHAFFYDSLVHHGRPGFIWQKLRGPRTYDYLKTETKGYDERLRMPKFPLKEDEIEAIMRAYAEKVYAEASDHPLGTFSADQMAEVQDFYVDAGIVRGRTPVEDLYTNEFIE